MSARNMAIADVFDALLQKAKCKRRSIRDHLVGVGDTFAPKIAEVCLNDKEDFV